MATILMVDEFKKYFENLTSTSTIVDSFGTTFVTGSNLYVGEESEKEVNMLTIYPVPGGVPLIDNRRQESAVQLRIKSTSNSIGLRTLQDTINILHQNDNVCASTNGRVYATQSSPMPLGKIEGGRFSIYVVNFDIKHIKL